MSLASSYTKEVKKQKKSPLSQKPQPDLEPQKESKIKFCFYLDIYLIEKSL